jgi:broad specificity phosphatase PhoE
MVPAGKAGHGITRSSEGSMFGYAAVPDTPHFRKEAKSLAKRLKAAPPEEMR